MFFIRLLPFLLLITSNYPCHFWGIGRNIFGVSDEPTKIIGEKYNTQPTLRMLPSDVCAAFSQANERVFSLSYTHRERKLLCSNQGKVNLSMVVLLKL
jgi:hypothetical protein